MTGELDECGDAMPHRRVANLLIWGTGAGVLVSDITRFA
jgi:hypothetical protein